MLSRKQAVTRYVTALCIFIAGIVGFVAFLISSIWNITDMKQYVVPGVHTLELERPGNYTIFHEYKSMIDGEYIWSEGFPAGLKIVVTSHDGDTLPVEPLRSGSSYSVGSREGSGVASFRVASPGIYSLSGTFTGSSAPKTVLTVTSGFMSGLFKTVFGGIAILGGSMILSFILALLTLLKQLDQKKKSEIASK